jgi:osmotically-inducible protein OsmY
MAIGGIQNLKAVKGEKMAYDEYDYGPGRYGRGYYGSERYPYHRRYGSYYDEPYQSQYISSQYDEPPYRSHPYRDYYNEPYGSYGYSRYGYRRRYSEPYRGGYEEGYDEPYYRRRPYRGAEDRGFWERAGDEVRSWFGDEEAERRRRMDEMRSGTYVGRGPRGYKRSDERIREDVNDRLTDDYYLDASDIEVSVNDCVVTLSGRVDSRYDKRYAEAIAESVSGVTDVTNQLRVGQSSTTAGETTGTTRSRTART